MPTPWLSWPRRLASTRCSATMAASAGELPPAATMRFASASNLAWSMIMHPPFARRTIRPVEREHPAWHLGEALANAGIEGPPAGSTNDRARRRAGRRPYRLALALVQDFNLRRQVGIAAEAVGRVVARQNPHFVV